MIISQPARRVRAGAFTVVGIVALAGALGLTPLAHGRGLDRSVRPLDPAALFALQARAFTEAEALPGFSRPRSLQVRLGEGQGVEAALESAGVPSDQAGSAVAALSDEVDTVNTHDGQTLEVALAQSRSPGAPARLIGLSMASAPDASLVLSRGADGAFVLHRAPVEPPPTPAPVTERQAADPPAVVKGVVQGSLYLSIADSGASLKDAAEALRQLSHRVDLSRDVDTGDGFRLAFDQTGPGQKGELRYVELSSPRHITRLYALPGRDGRPVWADEQGRPLQGGLLRTPVDAIRITSGFGLRLHPILGYSRMHQGVDFGAPAGSAVYAAGEGVIEEARWNGGYGRWVRIRHNGGWETGYGHLSAFASDLGPGTRVHQGQVIGYVGASGLATGPHLHFEVIKDGEHMDPRTADPQVPTALGAGQMAALETLKSRLSERPAAGAGQG